MERCPICADIGLVLDTKPVVGRAIVTLSVDRFASRTCSTL